MLYQLENSFEGNGLPTTISASLEKFLSIAALASACDDILSAGRESAEYENEINNSNEAIVIQPIEKWSDYI